MFLFILKFLNFIHIENCNNNTKRDVFYMDKIDFINTYKLDILIIKLKNF